MTTTSAAGSYLLKLFIAGNTPTSDRARLNLQRICDLHLPGRHSITVIDVTRRPELAELQRILATPTLIREFPQPVRRIIGDLSDLPKVLMALDLTPLIGSPGNVSSQRGGGSGGTAP